MSDDAAAVGDPLPFREAIDYFRQKINLPTDAWTDLREGQHTRAFVIAGATKAEFLTDMRAALQEALDNGTTLETFRQDFDQIVARHGWTYKGSRGWRSRVIYDTNLRMARAAGRWQQIERAREREARRGRTLYLRYVAVRDSRTRPEHLAWHGIVLPADHPWWHAHYPPNGWRCRCTIMVLTERDMARYGYTVTPDDQIPPVDMEDRTVRLADGSTETWPTPKGIDTGFGYHVGRAAHGQSVDRRVMAAAPTERTKRDWIPIGRRDTWRSLSLPETLPVDAWDAPRGAAAADSAEMLERVRDVLGGAGRTVLTPDGEAVQLTAEVLADHLAPERAPFLPLLIPTLERPAEIWLAWERHVTTGQVALRKRFLRVVHLDRGRGVLVVAQAVLGRFEGWTFMPVRRTSYLNDQRQGQLLYRREE
ncbi:PBECR2 nuclease fold domain-containing protein [Roseospira visakhapatnamensis]|uniref:SPP1 gp7 family putative phage head morphogenesis protein n=1 Tax=Roseospira visakhapatnamensis TaxID=390880 RepID=A0A7W6WC30_9PROT|nr:PBECR2 nuclease fold domain-containing protein [Roseospira visakhapatnamensis]MBB4268161.1 SPP1 gp7 family putative phage head morphogenesis protein [Roseospira visakhapatnamensis]